MPSKTSTTTAPAVEQFDLGAARARRLEEIGELPAFKIGDDIFTMPPVTEWPLEFPELLAQGESTAALRLLLGDEQYDRFMEHKPTLGDVASLVEWAASLAGGLGN
jgi:hypothetical protein